MKFSSDIDIDFANRDDILSRIKHINAAIITNSEYKKHPTGIYATRIPNNPINDLSTLDYKNAEKRGYIKLDFLNVWVYKHIKNESHLIEMMKEPNWDLLKDRQFFEKLIHIGKHYDIMSKMPEAINSIKSMAMFLAIIRPAAKHLIGKNWVDVEKEIWNIKSTNEIYAFKKAHAISYSNLVVVQMNLMQEDILKFN